MGDALPGLVTAWDMISLVIPFTLMSIWTATMPRFDPATLKSMSPMASSSPSMSERMTSFPSCMRSPMAMPATGSDTGTPASIRERQPAHDGGHGGRAVRFEDLGDYPNGVGEVLFRGKYP